MEEIFGQDVYFRRAGNLSLDGVFFEQTLPHRSGTRLNLKLSVPGHERIIETEGEVVTSGGPQEAPGMGIRFLRLNEQDRALLQSYLEEISSLRLQPIES
jgi:uncharacterized protein (TIGR02266 family)